MSLLPTECLEKLKCSLCKRLLSVFPIYIDRKKQQLSLCGRCYQFEDDDTKENYLRNELAENFAEYLLFPCINQQYGCLANLSPKDVVQHELICEYQQKSCIFHEQFECKWNGISTQLFKHYAIEHNDIFIKNKQFVFDISDDHEFSKIYQYCNDLFLFNYSFEHSTKQLKCSLMPFILNKRTTTTTKYYGKINLTIEGDNTTSIEKHLDIDKLNENNSKSFNINVATILNQNNNAKMVKGTMLIVDNKAKLNYNTKQNQKLSKLIKCFKCLRVLFDDQEYIGLYSCIKDWAEHGLESRGSQRFS